MLPTWKRTSGQIVINASVCIAFAVIVLEKSKIDKKTQCIAQKTRSLCSATDKNQAATVMI